MEEEGLGVLYVREACFAELKEYLEKVVALDRCVWELWYCA